MIDANYHVDLPDAPKFKFSSKLTCLCLVLICTVSVTLGLYIKELRTAEGGDPSVKASLVELQLSTTQLIGLSKSAFTGNKLAFLGLKEQVASMDEYWALLNEELPKDHSLLGPRVQEIEEVWGRTRHNVLVVVQNEGDLLLMNDMAITLNEVLPHLQAEHGNMVEMFLDSGASAEQVSLVLRQSWFAERIGRNLDRMMIGGEGSNVAADKFYSDASRFGKVLESMKTGNPVMGISKVKGKTALKSLKKSTELYNLVKGTVKDLFERSSGVSRASLANQAIADGGPLLLEQLIQFGEQYSTYEQERSVIKRIALTWMSGFTLFLFLAILLKVKLEARLYYKEVVTAK